jgi:hypothetical protein
MSSARNENTPLNLRKSGKPFSHVKSRVSSHAKRPRQKYNTISGGFNAEKLAEAKALYQKEQSYARARMKTPARGQPKRSAWTTSKSKGSCLERSSSDKNDDGDNVKVFVRIRPFAQRPQEGPAGASSSCSDIEQVAHATSDGLGVKLGGTDCEATKTFTFDRVFNNSSEQAHVFESVGKPVVDAAVEGYNGSVFAYGQTGSGKTYTMLGSPSDPGLIPRVIQYLFSKLSSAMESSESSLEVHHIIRVSYVEIYNERILDLLDVEAGTKALRETIKRGVYVQDLVEKRVSSPADAAEWMEVGNNNRKTASTAMNSESSRSHAVFSLTVEMSMINSETGVRLTRHSRVNLVDLAGSERQRDTLVTGARLKEASTINKSLSVLGNVIMSLVNIAGTGKSRHIHYRDSKLTFLLRDSLGGNTRTSMIATVSPSSRNFAESLSTLKFAKRAKHIRNKVVANEDAAGTADSLRKEIKRLKGRIRTMMDEGTGIQKEGNEELGHLKMILLKQDHVWKKKMQEMGAQLKEALKRADSAETKLESLTLRHAMNKRRESSMHDSNGILSPLHSIRELPDSESAETCGSVPRDGEELASSPSSERACRDSARKRKWRQSMDALNVQSRDNLLQGPVLAMRVQELNDETVKLRTELECTKDEKETMVDITEETKRQNQMLKEKLSNQAKLMEEMEFEINKLSKLSPSKKDSIALLNQTLLKTEKSLKEKIKRLTLDNSESTAKLESVKRDLKSASSAAVTLQKELHNKRSYISGIELSSAELQSKFADTKEQLKQAEEKVQQYQSSGSKSIAGLGLFANAGAASKAVKTFGLGLTISQGPRAVSAAQRQQTVLQQGTINALQKALAKSQSEIKELKTKLADGDADYEVEHGRDSESMNCGRSSTESDATQDGRESVSSTISGNGGRESNVSTASTGSTFQKYRYVSPVRKTTSDAIAGARFSVAKYFPGKSGATEKWSKTAVKRRANSNQSDSSNDSENGIVDIDAD